MAIRELYERPYAHGIVGRLRVFREEFQATVIGRDGSKTSGMLQVGYPRYEAAWAEIDRRTGAEPIADWVRVLECPVCDAKRVALVRHSVEESEVECRRCGGYRIALGAKTLFAYVHEGIAPHERYRPLLDDLGRCLRDASNHERTLTVTIENWRSLADQGRRVREAGS